MIQPPLNWHAILGAAAARIVILMLWYSPVLFWSRWSRLSGISKAKAQKGMSVSFIVDVAGSVLMAFILAHAIFYAGARTLPLGLSVSFLNWLGFVALAQIVIVTYEKKPFGLYAIYTGSQLVAMLAMGAILTVWGIRWV